MEYKLQDEINELKKEINTKCYALDFCHNIAKHYLQQGNKKDALKLMYAASDPYIDKTELNINLIFFNNELLECNFNINEALIQLKDTVVHKQYVLKSSLKMMIYFLKQGNKDIVKSIMKRASAHDISKFQEEEFDALSKISNDMSCMENAEQALTEAKENAIKLHWANNSHHPEYWKNYSNMEELDIIEMVIDWHSRSTQYNTDLLSFVETRQKNRFHFPQDIYEKILFYCNILFT